MSPSDERTVTGRSGAPKAPRWRKEPTAPPQPRRSWQSAAGSGGAPDTGRFTTARHRIGFGILLTIFLGLAALLVYYLTLLPAKTPLIAAVAVDYPWPLPPNGWAQEDIDGLKAHLGDQTLSIRDLSLAGSSSDEVLARLAHQLELAAGEASRSGAVVVYLSAHGVVDGEGRPCLLLPGADPLDSSTWVLMSDVLAQFRSIEPRHCARQLLILDGNRQLANWSIGLLDNGFADGLEKVVAEAKVPGLAVLNSASPGQVGWTSMHLRGSVFGHSLQLGLAGDADGDGDRRVSLHELYEYLQENVEAWVRQHRAARQTPILYPADAPDFPIVWSLNRRDLRRLAAQTGKRAAAPGASASTRLARLWEKHQQFEKSHPHHYAPWKWHELECRLLWLERAALAGTAYGSSFEQTYQELEARLDGVLREVPSSSDPNQEAVAPVKLAFALAGDETPPADEFDVYSLPLAKYLGTAGPSLTRQSGMFSDVQLARLFDRYGVSRLWDASDVKGRALELHRLGERLAVPGPFEGLATDQRAHSLIRPLLDGCDQARRTLEDRVFLGPQETADLAEQLRQVQQRYEDAERMEAALARQYQVRDRLWRELPYLTRAAAWLEDEDERDREGGIDTHPNGDRRTGGSVLALVEAANRLDKALQQAEQAADNLTGDENALLAGDLETALNKFRARLRGEAARLPLAPATPETLREIENLLAMPLVSGSERTSLFTRYVEVAAEIDSRSAEGGAESGDSAGSGGGVSGDERPDRPQPSPLVELASETGWQIHPVAALLRPIDGPATAPDRANLPALGERLRRALREAASLPLGDGVTDRRLRRLAALQSVLQPDPFPRLRRRHLQDLLLWHCHRKLEDFWGSVEPGGPPYFADAAESYLAGIPLLAQPDSQIEGGIGQLTNTLDLRRKAARGGLATTSTDVLLIDEDSETAAQVAVHATAEAHGLPDDGAAAVYLRDQEEIAAILSTIHPLQVGPSVAGDQVTVSVKGLELAIPGRKLQAVAMLRGNEFAGPLTARKVGGRKIEVVRHRYGPSRITLWGPRFKQAAIVFILDCSNSMKDPVPVEAPDFPGQQGQMTKLNVAIDALRGMMERLGEQADSRVGVRFFGHRVGWRTDQSGVVARQESYPGGVPPTLRPYEDVELFLPLGRFDSVTAGVVNQRLASLNPWGESPIYLAMMEALKDFDNEDPDAERRVVVITDGVNYQFNPPPESGPPRSLVEEAYASRGVGIDIVGFAIPEEEQSEASREFRQLAGRTGGSFTNATNASSLIRTLEQLVVKTQFRVVDDAGSVSQADLGSTVELPLQEGTRVCRVQVEQLQADALLEGGEALQLTVSSDGARIVALPYEEGAPVLVPLVTAAPTGASGYHVGLHRPLRESRAVVFPITFQKDDLGIPSRLDQVWIEITPAIGGRPVAADRYVFFDANYEPDAPVPLLHCRCSDWPPEADQADARVWCLPEAGEPAEVVPLDQVANRAPPSGEGFELKKITGVRYQVRTAKGATPGGPLEVRVVQRHEAGVPVNAVKLELFPQPDRVLHQFDEETHLVLHTFEYHDSGARPVPAAELRFQTREQLTGTAWRLEKPVTLGIAKHEEVVAPPRIVDPRTSPARAAPTSR
jgi:hypothetical protein